MSFGFPMVVSKDATCDVVRDGENGFVVDYFDEMAIASRLVWFAEDWERVHAMRECVLKSVSWRTIKDYADEVAEYLISL